MTWYKKLTIYEICQKIVYISKFVKNTTLHAEKFGNINLNQQTVLLKRIYDFRIEIFYEKIEIFDFRKTPFGYVFSIAINVFL